MHNEVLHFRVREMLSFVSRVAPQAGAMVSRLLTLILMLDVHVATDGDFVTGFEGRMRRFAGERPLPQGRDKKRSRFR